MTIYLIALGSRIYIGQTSVPAEKRKARHLRDLRKGEHSNPILQRAFNKYGEAHFHFEIIERHDTQIECDAAEAFYIGYLRFIGANVCNSRAGGKSGGRLSVEARQKIGAASSRNNKGRPMHPNTSAALRQAHVGRPISARHRAAISNANQGRAKSSETRLKLSVAGKGRRLLPHQRTNRSLKLIGRAVSEETRAKIRLSLERHYRERGGGRLHTLASRQRVSQSLRLFNASKLKLAA